MPDAPRTPGAEGFDYRLLPVDTAPCPYCKSGPLEMSDVGGGVYEDMRYRCRACGKAWVVEGADS